MQRHTIFIIVVNALHVSGGLSAHHQDLKNCTHSIWYVPSLLAATASVAGLELPGFYSMHFFHRQGPDHVTCLLMPDIHRNLRQNILLVSQEEFCCVKKCYQVRNLNHNTIHPNKYAYV